MKTTIDNKYAKLKNYELESVFDMSKKQKQELESKIDPKMKHMFKLQEMYLKANTAKFEQLESEVLQYIEHHSYLLDDQIIGAFYEYLAAISLEQNADFAAKYFDLANQKFPTLYTVKHSLYFALKANNIYMAARILLIAIESDIQFDSELSYYNLIVEHYFEEDILSYYNLMTLYKDKYISVDNLTVEFSFNELITKYYIEKYLKENNNKDELIAKKDVNELLLKTISSMKNEDDLRSQVLRGREAIEAIENNPDVDIFELITFNLIPVPSGLPHFSPFNKIKK